MWCFKSIQHTHTANKETSNMLWLKAIESCLLEVHHQNMFDLNQSLVGILTGPIYWYYKYMSHTHTHTHSLSFFFAFLSHCHTLLHVSKANFFWLLTAFLLREKKINGVLICPTVICWHIFAIKETWNFTDIWWTEME